MDVVHSKVALTFISGYVCFCGATLMLIGLACHGKLGCHISALLSQQLLALMRSLLFLLWCWPAQIENELLIGSLPQGALFDRASQCSIFNLHVLSTAIILLLTVSLSSSYDLLSWAEDA